MIILRNSGHTTTVFQSQAAQAQAVNDDKLA